MSLSCRFNQCYYKTNDNEEFYMHELAHEKPGTVAQGYNCPSCEFISPGKMKIFYHLRKNHFGINASQFNQLSNSILITSIVKRNTRSWRQLLPNEIVHTFKCACKNHYQTIDPKTANNHIDDKHSSKVFRDLYLCSFPGCSEIKQQKNALNKHLDDTHELPGKIVPGFVCLKETCPTAATYFPAIITHIGKAHSEFQATVDDIPQHSPERETLCVKLSQKVVKNAVKKSNEKNNPVWIRYIASDYPNIFSHNCGCELPFTTVSSEPDEALRIHHLLRHNNAQEQTKSGTNATLVNSVANPVVPSAIPIANLSQIKSFKIVNLLNDPSEGYQSDGEKKRFLNANLPDPKRQSRERRDGIPD